MRQYTDWGLVYTVGRSAAGYRLFDSDAVWCVQMIGEFRGLGLTAAEIRKLTTAYLQGSPALGPQLAERLHASRQRIVARIAELRQTPDSTVGARTLDPHPGVRPYRRRRTANRLPLEVRQ